MGNWQELTVSEIEGGDFVTFEVQAKLRDRDNANFNNLCEIYFSSVTTTASSYTDLASIKIKIPDGKERLIIKSKVGVLSDTAGERGYIRFRIGSTYSTEDYVEHNGSGSPTWRYKDPATCELDVSALSGNQTLYLQGYTDGMDSMSGEVADRYDSYWQLT